MLAGARSAVVGNSDVLCALNGVGGGLPPSSPKLQLNESTIATVTWAPSASVPDATYVVVAFGNTGVRSIPVPSATLTVSDDTGGNTTCYVVVGLLDGSVVGATDALCGIPGLSHL